jgi:hypothetical protein
LVPWTHGRPLPRGQAAFQPPDYRHLILGGGNFRQPRAAVKEEKDSSAAASLYSAWKKQRAQSEFLPAAGWRLLLQPRVRPGVFYHG